MVREDTNHGLGYIFIAHRLLLSKSKYYLVK